MKYGRSGDGQRLALLCLRGQTERRRQPIITMEVWRRFHMKNLEATLLKFDTFDGDGMFDDRG